MAFVSPFDASEGLCFVIVTFPGYRIVLLVRFKVHPCYAHSPFSMWEGERAYSITAVRTYVRPIRLVHNQNGFRSISFEKISVLDSNFIHRYIIIKCRSSSI